MYPQAASAIEQVAVFVYAAECRLAVIDADPPAGWALDAAGDRSAARDALRRLHVYPPQAGGAIRVAGGAWWGRMQRVAAAF
jgi:hypothetical protein